MQFFRPVVPLRFVLALLCTALFVIQLGISLGDVPTTMVMQQIICEEYFNARAGAGETLPEELCLDASVQRRLNFFTIGSLISVTVAGALVAVPYGLFSDKIGRIPVLGMSILSILLSQGFSIFILAQNGRVPLQAIWGIGVPLLLGGGRPVAEAVVFTIISDMAVASRRTNYFQWVAGAVLLGQMFGLLLAQPLAEKSVWIPIGLSPGLVLLGGLAIVVFTPETLCLGLFKQRADASSPLQPCAVLAIPVASMQSEIMLRFLPSSYRLNTHHLSTKLLMVAFEVHVLDASES
ncbi:MFS efflux pump atnC [Paramyrothecium foliicola]|nr:MFS efflux pump atnC [Paramyrothecium foliicola]